MDIFGFGVGGKQSRDGDSGEYTSYYKGIKKPRHWVRWLAVIIAVVALAAAAAGAYTFLMEYWQYAEIGQEYTGVFWINLVAKGATLAAGFVVIFAIFLVNVLLLKKFAIDKYLNIRLLKWKWPYVVVCLLLALLMSDVLKDDLYLKLLQAANSVSFGVTDPLFSQDVGYYVFVRPFLITVTGGLKGIVMFQIVLVAAVYLVLYIKNGLHSLKQMFAQERRGIIHIVINILLYFVLMALTYKFVKEDMLYAGFGREGSMFGAGYVDATIWLNYYRIIPWVLLAVIILSLVFLYRKKLVHTIVSIAVIPVAFIITAIVAGAVQSLVVSPDERNMQRPYIEHNMAATRAAYRLDNVAQTDFDVKNDLTQAEISENQDVIKNIRITDFNATLTAYNQLQYLRRYYTFNDLDIVPYELDGKLTAMFVAPREMNKDNMEQSAQSYVNQVFRYTHGFGAVASPINLVTPEGQPEFFIRDIPPQSTNGMPDITQPRIYYGELTNDYVITNPNKPELDYSEDTKDYENSYDGAGGIQLDFIKKLMFAIREGDYRMFFSGNIDAQSRIMINRNIFTRVSLVAPFLQFDGDPYMVIDDNGRLKWVMDAYTTTDKYPYAQPSGNINYIRNSVKAVVDAYDGTVDFYIIDPDDPLIQVYDKIYPGVFKHEPLPAEIADHIVIPMHMFKVQTQIYQLYHMDSADQLYDKADVWRIATEKYTDTEVSVEPYFNIMRMDDTGRDELILTMPYVLGDKHNMVGMLMARTCQEHYGELMLYRFPKNITIYGPMQIENKIDNDPDISREMTLWGQGGSNVIRGNLLVVPFKDSLIYVEPVYITSKNNASLPELKRVVVGYQDAIAMEATLEQSLEAVFREAGAEVTLQQGGAGGQTPPETGAPQVTPGEIDALSQAIQGAVDAYGRFKSASGSNDWEAMGKSLAELDGYMNQLQQEGAGVQ